MTIITIRLTDNVQRAVSSFQTQPTNATFSHTQHWYKWLYRPTDYWTEASQSL